MLSTEKPLYACVSLNIVHSFTYLTHHAIWALVVQPGTSCTFRRSIPPPGKSENIEANESASFLSLSLRWLYHTTVVFDLYAPTTCPNVGALSTVPSSQMMKWT